jgi:hypothetical protein
MANGGRAPDSIPIGTLYNHHRRITSDDLLFSNLIQFYPAPQSKDEPILSPQVPGPSDFIEYGPIANHSPGIENTPVWRNHAGSPSSSRRSPTTLFLSLEHCSPKLTLPPQNELLYSSDKPVLEWASRIHSPSGVMLPNPESPAHQSSPIVSPHSPNCCFNQTQPHPPSSPPLGRERTPSRMRQRRHIMQQKSPCLSSEVDSSTSGSSVKKQKKRRTQQIVSQTGTEGRAVRFINLTPRDSRNILSSVAPSGSSKTKTRRRIEAERKMRNVLREAVNSIQEGGGIGDIATQSSWLEFISGS